MKTKTKLISKMNTKKLSPPKIYIFLNEYVLLSTHSSYVLSFHIVDTIVDVET